ncbi:MAG: WbqC family protein, partial [Actinomycetota bacterium]|nr:WbqC family protein [Actinomycetota bacterium]
MIVTIMQPAYLPWLGYFDRLLKSDCFVVLDHVDMDRNSKTKFTNRNRIRTSRGTKWLTVPVRSSGTSGNLPISDMRIADDSS